ncbi:helix-turn-helix transcriptional regulator [Pseudomonas rhodesiae]|uniref:helix-turn-helix domain-containing protein n=1 Tax=Pseudomonas rhodesiae TaxID=76760 RepID=UPI0027373B62|nr:helix-turn-helix transcriptional regulator [Pseudomonas rhodesiae]WLI26920.1 helix-turn-helix transcriptional regulator [Pseudomonas rhodesiae]
MELKQAFGAALKKLRSERKLSQEDFSDVSSRTYLSTLERGLKSPTIEKVDELASVLNVHPLTILVGWYPSGQVIYPASQRQVMVCT